MSHQGFWAAWGFLFFVFSVFVLFCFVLGFFSFNLSFVPSQDYFKGICLYFSELLSSDNRQVHVIEKLHSMAQNC
jgi:hypothetical protein